MVTKLMVTETFLLPSGLSESVPVQARGPANMSVLQAWQWAITQGRTVEARALRRILDGLEEEPTPADAEWQ